MPKVYIINKGGHDFSAARAFGEIVYLSEGLFSPFSVDRMYREFAKHLKHSSPDDYILSTGLSIMNSIACAMFAHKHDGTLNLLLYRNKEYISRTLKLGELL
jgi:hypothetical protein